MDLGTIIILEGRERGKGEEERRGEGDGDRMHGEYGVWKKDTVEYK